MKNREKMWEVGKNNFYRSWKWEKKNVWENLLENIFAGDWNWKIFIWGN